MFEPIWIGPRMASPYNSLNIFPHILLQKNSFDLNLSEGLCIYIFFSFLRLWILSIEQFWFLFRSIFNGVTLKTRCRIQVIITPVIRNRVNVLIVFLGQSILQRKSAVISEKKSKSVKLDPDFTSESKIQGLFSGGSFWTTLMFSGVFAKVNLMKNVGIRKKMLQVHHLLKLDDAQKELFRGLEYNRYTNQCDWSQNVQCGQGRVFKPLSFRDILHLVGLAVPKGWLTLSNGE